MKFSPFWITFSITLLVYFSTVSSSCSGGDSGELIATAVEKTIAHPPGYPLFIALYHLFGVQLLLPLFSSSMINKNDEITIPLIFNCISCVLSSFASGFLALACSKFLTLYYDSENDSNNNNTNINIKQKHHQEEAEIKINLASICSALIFSFSPTVWTYSIQTEVFPLHTLFMCLLMYLLLRYEELLMWSQKEENSNLLFHFSCFSSFICGLSLTNQHTSILTVFPVAVWIVFYRQKLFSFSSKRFSDLIYYLLFFFLGLSPYLLLFYFGYREDSPNSEVIPSLMTWGGDTHTIQGFLSHLLRKDYGTFSLGSQESDYLSEDRTKNWSFYVNDFIMNQIGVYNIPLLVLSLLKIVLNLVTSISSSSNNSSNNNNKKSKLSEKKKKTTTTTTTTSQSSNKNESELNEATTTSESKYNNCFNQISCFVIFLWFFYLLIFHSLSNLPIEKPLFLGVMQRFWIHSFIFPVILMSYGIYLVFDLVEEKFQSSSFFSYQIFLVVLSIVLSVVIPLLLHFDSHNESQNFIVENFGRAILDSIPSKTRRNTSNNNNLIFLFTKGDLIVNSVRYNQIVNKYRFSNNEEGNDNNVIVLDQEMLTYPWFVSRVKRHFEMKEKIRKKKQKKKNGDTDNDDDGIVINFPGKFYNPSKKEGFSMYEFLKANNVLNFSNNDNKNNQNRNQNRNRAFFCYGTKEGDTSLLQNGFALRTSGGLVEEIVPRNDFALPQLISDENIIIWMKELMLSLPKSLLRKIEFQNNNNNNTEITTTRSTRSTRRRRRAGYDSTSWESVVSSDLVAAIQKNAHTLMQLVEAKKEKFSKSVSSHPKNTKNNNNNIDEKISPKNVNFKVLEKVCRKFMEPEKQEEKQEENNGKDNNNNESPRLVALCSIFAAETLFDQLFVRFAEHEAIDSTVYRNRASLAQTTMTFIDTNSNKEMNSILNQKMIENLRGYLKFAAKEKVSKKEIESMTAALKYFEQQQQL